MDCFNLLGFDDFFNVFYYCIQISVSGLKRTFENLRIYFQKKIMPKISWNRWAFHNLFCKSLVKPEKETIPNDIKKFVKIQQVKPIHKIRQRPEVLRTFDHGKYPHDFFEKPGDFIKFDIFLRFQGFKKLLPNFSFILVAIRKFIG